MFDIRLDDIGLRLARYAPHARMARHTHDEASLGVIVAGGFRERIGGEARDYASGTLSFCPAGIEHAQDFGADGARQIIFQPRQGWLDWLSDARSTSPYVRSAGAHALGARLLAEMARDDEFSVLAREGLLLEIVAALGRSTTQDDGEAAIPPWLLRARDYLQAQSSEPLSMTAVARVAGRHEVHVARAFRRHFGVTVGAYLRRLRAEEAACLLLRTRKDITEIACDCGFASHAHLCRVFKAQYGLTPSQYRARRG